jgi:hypothetical protein
MRSARGADIAALCFELLLDEPIPSRHRPDEGAAFHAERPSCAKSRFARFSPAGRPMPRPTRS